MAKKLSEAELDAELSATPSMSEEELDALLNENDSQQNGSLPGGRNPFESLSGSLGEPAADILEAVGDITDYPAAPVRATVGAMMDAPSGKFVDPLDFISEGLKPLVEGPSSAPTGEELARKAGIPEDMVPLAGGAADVASGVFGGEALNLGTKAMQKFLSGMAKGASKVIDPVEQGIKATGMKQGNVESMMRAGDEGADATKDAVNYAIDSDILSANPFKAGTVNTLRRVQRRSNDIGSQIGKIRDTNAARIEAYLNRSENIGKAEVSQYLEAGFNPANSKERIFQMVDEIVEDADWSEKVKAFVADKIDKQAVKYKGGNPDLKQLARLKTDWQRQVNYLKNQADMSVSELGYNLLQQEAKRAMDHELDFVGKFAQGSEKARHSQLMKEYGSLSRIEDGLVKRAASESRKPMDFNLTKPLQGASGSQRLQSALAKVPQKVNTTGVDEPFGVRAGLFGAAQVPLTVARQSQPVVMVDGFDMNKTIPVDPDQAAFFRHQVQTNPKISVTEKAKLLNLLNKHDRIPFGY